MSALTKTQLLPIVLGILCISCSDTINEKAARKGALPAERTELQLRAKGKVTAIGAGTKLQVSTVKGASSPRGTANPKSDTVVAATNEPRYIVHANGDLFVELSKPPATNGIAFSRWGGDDPSSRRVAIFRLTNPESREIALWNVRVQVRATGPSADRSGWETVHNDYPAGPGPAHIEAAKSSEFQVNSPGRTPWRVCILYSRELLGAERPPGVQKCWGGDYEIIGQEMKE